MEGQPDTDTQQPNDPALEAARRVVKYIRSNPHTGSAEKIQNLLVALRECGLAHLIGSLDLGNQRMLMRLLAAGPRAWFIAAHADDYAGSLGHSDGGYGTVETAAEFAAMSGNTRTNVGYWNHITKQE
jgi:hypothetical protein